MFEEQLVAVIVWLLIPATVLISSVGAGLAFHTIGRTLPEDEEEELGASRPQVEPGAKTRDTVAKAAGFSSTTEYRRVKTVVERGVSELVAVPGAP